MLTAGIPGVATGQELTVATIVGVIAILTAVAATARWAVRQLAPVFRRTRQFLDDWFGEEARPGVPRRAGIGERLSDVQDDLSQVKTEQSRVSRELQDNHGSSLKDAVRRIEHTQKLAQTAQRQDRKIVETLTVMVGAFVGQEQAARRAGNEASAEAWLAIQAIHEAPHREDDIPPPDVERRATPRDDD